MRGNRSNDRSKVIGRECKRCIVINSTEFRAILVRNIKTVDFVIKNLYRFYSLLANYLIRRESKVGRLEIEVKQ